MHEGDALLLPKCEVAEDATYCWHDVIKNKIQAYSDPFLERWVSDSENVEKFEATLDRVVADLEGFSPARAVDKLKPMAGMPEMVRRELVSRLHESFQRGFPLSEMRDKLSAVRNSLAQALRECRFAKVDSRRERQLANLRTAAMAVRRELESLPAGFWIPPRR